MPSTPALSMPTQGQPVIDKDGKATQVWWRYFYGLYKRTAATVPYITASGLAATGSVQSDALALTAQWNQLATVAAGTGVKLGNLGAGVAAAVWNDGAEAVNVYPPSGGEIDALGADAPYVLAAAKSQQFFQLSSTSFRTVQP